MITADKSAFLQLREILTGVLQLDPSTFMILYGLPDSTLVAWSIVVTVGVSEAIGLSGMLFLNRIKPKQFLGALLNIAISLSVSLFLWLLSTWLIVNFVFDGDIGFRVLANTLAFSCIPLLFSFLTLMPYLGVAIFTVTGFWTLLAMLVGLQAVADIGNMQAFIALILGYIILLLSQRTIGRPIVALARQLERQALGTEIKTDLLELYSITQEELEKLKLQVESELIDAEST